MNTPNLDKLKKHLAEISDEQFQQEWAEIENLQLGGISVENFLKQFHVKPSVSHVKNYLEQINFSYTDDEYNVCYIDNLPMAS
jgi:hypothetical protein